MKSQNDTNTVIKLNNQSSNLEKNDQSDSAIIIANEALSLSLKLKYKVGISEAYNNLGKINRHNANYPAALNFYYKGLAIDEEINNPEGALLKLGNIGIIYFNQGDYNNALTNYNKAEKIAEDLNNEEAIANVLSNKADVYAAQGKVKAALDYYDNAFEHYKTVNSKKGMSTVLINSGNVHIDNGNPKLALQKYLSALALLGNLKDNQKTATCLLNIAFAYSQIKNNKLAGVYFNRALNYAKDIDDLDLKCSLELAISEFYSEKHEFNKALSHFKNYIALKDSIYNDENTKQSIKAEMNYEFDKKQTAIKFEHDRIVYQLASDNKLQKQWRLFFIVVILLACAGLFFIKRAYDNKKRLASFLASEDQRKDVLLQEVHHRINNNLQIISSLLTLQANNADNERLTEYLTQSQNRIQSLSALHELLYDTSSPLEINMSEYVEKVLTFHRDILNTMAEKISIETAIDPVYFPTKLAVPLALIINELVTNSIKYAFKNRQNGIIRIQLEKIVTGDWSMTIADNGNGLPPETGRRNDSLGLKLVNIMTRQIKGKLTMKNENGAFFNIIFNIVKQK
ncbi:MAG: tetratricopeptide repeat protein [Bacteroidota bacterium]